MRTTLKTLTTSNPRRAAGVALFLLGLALALPGLLVALPGAALVLAGDRLAGAPS